MKKTFIIIVLALCALTVSAQMSHPVLVWQNGNKMTLNPVDSITFVQTPNVADSEFVDLGLSVKWAKCNIGAAREDLYGSYFAWGENRTKSVYTWDTYSLCDSSLFALTKYCVDSHYGKDGLTDGKTILEPVDDAATVLKGNAYRLPSYDDWLELKDNCKWKQETVNGHDGYRVTGPNGNSIFLPYAGYRNGQTRSNDGIDGCYWLGQTQGDGEAYVISLNRLHQSVGQMFRATGGSVRPVLP